MATTKTTKVTKTENDNLLSGARNWLGYARTEDSRRIVERGVAAFEAALLAADTVLDRPKDPDEGNKPRTDQLETLLAAAWALRLDADWQHEAHVQDAVVGLGILIGPTDHRYPTADDLDVSIQWAEVIVTAAEKYMESKEALA